MKDSWLKDNWLKLVTLSIVVLGGAMGYGVLLYKVEIVLANQAAMQLYISDDQVEDAKIHTKQNLRLDYIEKQ